MDYFENTTRITEDGYAAILQMQKKQHCIICRAIGILLAIPFLERLIYRGILLEIGDTDVIPAIESCLGTTIF